MQLSLLLFRAVPRSRGVPGRQWGGKVRKIKPVSKISLLTKSNLEERKKTNLELLSTPFLTTQEMQKVSLYKKTVMKQQPGT